MAYISIDKSGPWPPLASVSADRARAHVIRYIASSLSQKWWYYLNDNTDLYRRSVRWWQDRRLNKQYPAGVVHSV